MLSFLFLIQTHLQCWTHASFSRWFYDNPNWKCLFSREKLCGNNFMHFHSISSLNVRKKTDWAVMAVILQWLNLLFWKQNYDLNRMWAHWPVIPVLELDYDGLTKVFSVWLESRDWHRAVGFPDQTMDSQGLLKHRWFLLTKLMNYPLL